MSKDFRFEYDSMGEVEVPTDALYGAQTQRAINNFQFSSLRLPPRFIRALGAIKLAAARGNQQLGLLPTDTAKAIATAAIEVANGDHLDQFPIDIFQTGSGTSSNMNANEVIAHLASELSGTAIHPNDQVNLGQSSNDVIPSAVHVSAAVAIHHELLPALNHLIATVTAKAAVYQQVVKTGRTHLMDAMPLTLAQEMEAWAAQLQLCQSAVQGSMVRLQQLAIGATAVGSGVNAHPDFGRLVCAHLSQQLSLHFSQKSDLFEGTSSQVAALEMSGQLRTLATALLKISNDLRWMNSGPNNGLSEIELPSLQPGSSIMPGKVNPVIPEAVAMIAAQVTGNDATIAIAAQSGSFQLNVMLPVIAYNLVQSIELLTSACRQLADKAIAGFKVNEAQIAARVSRNPILVTALNGEIGYEKAAEIAKAAFAEDRPLIEVALEMTNLDRATLERLLDPVNLTGKQS